MCDTDLYRNSLSGGRPEKEPPRACWHCDAQEDDGAELHEAHCREGQGLLHCEECGQKCEKCHEYYCAWDLKFKEDGDGILLMCEECRKEIEDEKK